jgi:hypothetical protein
MTLAIYVGVRTVEQIGRHLSSAEDYTNMSYYNLCGIRSQDSPITKRDPKKRGGTYKNITGMKDSGILNAR